MRNKQPNQRQLKVGEEIRQLLAKIFIKQDFRDPLIMGVSITVTEVKITPDLRKATAFVLPLKNHNVDSIITGLEKCKGCFKQEISKKLRLRFMPELKFVYDKRFDEALHIENLLSQPEVLRDLKKETQ